MIFDIKKFTQSKSLKAIIATLVILAVLLGIFQAGVFVGFHKAAFLFKSGDNFYRNFGEKGFMMGGMGPGMGMFNDEFTGGHGAIGKIIKVNLPNLVVLGPDNIEKVIVTSDDTSIRKFRDNSSVKDLSVDQYITVLGSPNDQGQIVAKFIRIMPTPINNIQTSTTISATSTK